MKKSFKDRLSSLGLSYTKEVLFIIAIAIVFIVAGLLIILLLKEIYLGIIVFILGAVVELLYTSRYKTIEYNIKKDNVNEFVSNLSYFELFVSNGNDIYEAFRLLLPYCGQYKAYALIKRQQKTKRSWQKHRQYLAVYRHIHLRNALRKESNC